jgi:DNA polymerase phi
MHSLWGRVLCLLVPGLTLGDDGWPNSDGEYRGEEADNLPEKEHLRNFWGEVVEGSLLSSSAPRQFAAIKLAAAVLPYLNPSLVPLVFSPQFSKFLKKNFERKDNHLHRMAVWLVARLEEYCAREDTPGRVSAALRLGVLQICKGSGLGEKGDVAAGVGAGEGASLAFLGSLEDLFLEEAGAREGAENEKEDTMAHEKSKIVRQMCDLSRSKAATAAVRGRVLKFLAKAALVGDLPAALQPVVSEKLVELLSGLIRPVFRPQKGEGGAGKASGDSDKEDLLSEVAAFCLTTDPGSDDVAAKLAAIAAAAKKGASGDVTVKALALEQLALVLVVVHLADPEGEAGEVAEDLAVVAEKALNSVRKGRKKKAGSADEPAWQDVLVDILLSFLTQSSAALRTCVTAVWRAFCDDITAAGLKSITDVLTQGGSRPKEGEGSEDEEMEGEEEDGDDEGEDEEEEESDDTEGIEDGDAVANRGQEKAQGGSDSEGGSMDDEAMFRMDDAISSHLKLARGAQRAAKERRQELTNFKFRALGLVEDYIKFKPDSALTPNVVWPLLQSLSSAFSVQEEAAFAKKLSSVLSQKLLKARAGKNFGAAERSQASEVLAQALEMAVKWKHIELSRTAAAASLYLLKVTESGEGAADSGAGKALEEALKAFFTKKNCRVQQGFFENAFGRHPDLAVKAAPSLLAALESPRSDFMRVSALRLTFVSLKTAGGQMPAGLQSSLAKSFVACCAAEYKQKGHAEKALKDGSRILNLAQAHFPGKVSAAMRKAFLQALEREAAGSSQATAKRLLDALSPGTETGTKKRKSAENGGPKKAAKSKKII